MARAYNIHVVQDSEECNELVAAFTVKHELENWQKQHPEPRYFVTSIRDGRRGAP
jgi:hypothetical protein